MEMIDRVERLLTNDRSDSYIIGHLKITRGSLVAYKANITRRNNIRDSSRRLERYMTSPYIVIPSSKVLERLSPEQIPPFVDALDAMLAKSTKGHSSNGTHPSSDRLDEGRLVIKVFEEGKKMGLTNQEIYQDSRLKKFDRTSLAAYMAHFTRGTYD